LRATRRAVEGDGSAQDAGLRLMAY